MDNELQLIAKQYQLILEKDHRPKMEQFGIPEHVAEFLHNFNDKYSLWFANQFKKMFVGRMDLLRVSWIRGNVLHSMQSIVDWVTNTPNTFLKNYTWEQAVQAANVYHSNLQAKSLASEERHEIIKKYDDGFYWVDLESSHCREESSLMGHCGATSAETIFSLRKYTPETQTIEGFVSVAITPDEGIWYQAKGKKNSKPKEVYHKYIVDILVKHEVFQYEAEYNSINDFVTTDFERWLKKNPNTYDNQKEILAKLSDNGIQGKAEKLFAKYTFRHFGVFWEVMEDEALLIATAQSSIRVDVTDIKDIDDITWQKIDDKDEKKFLEIVYEVLSSKDIYVAVDTYSSNDWFQFNEKNGRRYMYIDVNLEMNTRDSNGPLDAFHYFLDMVNDSDRVIISDGGAMGQHIIMELKRNGILNSYYPSFINKLEENGEFDKLKLFSLKKDEEKNSVSFYGKIVLGTVSDELIKRDIYLPSLKWSPALLAETKWEKQYYHPLSYIMVWLSKYAPNLTRLTIGVEKNRLVLAYSRPLEFDGLVEMSSWPQGIHNAYNIQWGQIKSDDTVMMGVNNTLPEFYRKVIHPQFDNEGTLEKMDFRVVLGDNRKAFERSYVPVTIVHKQFPWVHSETYWWDDDEYAIEDYIDHEIRRLMTSGHRSLAENPMILKAINAHMPSEIESEDPRQMGINLESKKIRFKKVFYS